MPSTDGSSHSSLSLPLVMSLLFILDKYKEIDNNSCSPLSHIVDWCLLKAVCSYPPLAFCHPDPNLSRQTCWWSYFGEFDLFGESFSLCQKQQTQLFSPNFLSHSLGGTLAFDKSASGANCCVLQEVTSSFSKPAALKAVFPPLWLHCWALEYRGISDSR